MYITFLNFILKFKGEIIKSKFVYLPIVVKNIGHKMGIY